MPLLRHPKRQQLARFEPGHRFALQSLVGSHQDRKEPQETDLQAVAMPRAAIREDFKEPHVAQQVERIAAGGIGGGCEHLGVEPAFCLVIDPIRVPAFFPLLLL